MSVVLRGGGGRGAAVAQMLSEMDGFNDGGSPVVVMGATNRYDVLDPALVRPGRFDRVVYVDRPDFDGRIEVLKVHLRWDDSERCRSERDIDFAEFSSATNRFSGAALANLVNSAAVLAARDARDLICNQVCPLSSRGCSLLSDDFAFPLVVVLYIFYFIIYIHTVILYYISILLLFYFIMLF